MSMTYPNYAKRDIFSDGKLYGGKWVGDSATAGYRLQATDIPALNFKGIWSTPNSPVLYAYDGTYTYICVDEQYGFTQKVIKSGIRPFAIDWWDDNAAQYVSVFVCGNSMLKWNGAYSINTIKVSLYGGVVHRDRLFAASNSSGIAIHYSAPHSLAFEHDDIKGAGFIRLTDPRGGKILKLVEWGNDIVVVRERGLAVLHALGNPENFSIDHYTAYFGEVDEKSIAATLQGVIFTCEGKVFIFDGERVRPFDCQYNGLYSNVYCAVATADEYFISCAMGLMCIEVSTGKVSYIDRSQKWLTMRESVYALNDDNVISTIEEGDSFVWESKSYDFGTTKKKLLKWVQVQGSDIDSVTVYNERGYNRTCQLDGNTAYVNLFGEYFVVKVCSSGDICGVSAVVEE